MLINPRPVGESYTKYSFPSKTIEYMLSGTPLLMTQLEGVPSGYFDHVYSAGDGSFEALRAGLSEAMDATDAQRKEKGERARNFILSRCGAEQQAKRILDFLRR